MKKNLNTNTVDHTATLEQKQIPHKYQSNKPITHVQFSPGLKTRQCTNIKVTQEHHEETTKYQKQHTNQKLPNDKSQTLTKIFNRQNICKYSLEL